MEAPQNGVEYANLCHRCRRRIYKGIREINSPNRIEEMASVKRTVATLLNLSGLMENQHSITIAIDQTQGI
jgi:hypothetical protein